MFDSLSILRNPNYRLYCAGQAISMSGNWMQMMAQSWLVYRLSGSAAWLGGVTFASQATAFLVSPWSGVIADQFDRRNILVAVQLGGMIQAILLAVLAGSGHIEPWHIAVMATLQGMFNAFEITTRHTFAQDVVGREHLGSAIAVNAVVINASRVVGPALGGVLIPLIGEVGCFRVNAVSYLGVLVCLMWMKLPARQRGATLSGEGPADLSMLARISETIRYIRRKAMILRMMGLAAFVSFVALPYTTLLPVFAKDVLHGDEKLLGWLSAMSGIGAVAGALTLGVNSKSEAQVENRLLNLVMLTGAFAILLAWSREPWLSCVATFFIGASLMSMFPQINVTIQRAVEDRVRGRVLSLYNMTFFGAMPVGSLLAGTLSDLVGVSYVVTAAGAFCILFSIAARCFSWGGKVTSTSDG